MFKPRPCGCKGVRSCKSCEKQHGAWRLQQEITQQEKDHSYVYCIDCQKLWPGWELEQHSQHKGNPLSISGIEVILNFISEDEEVFLMKNIEEIQWQPSQSGRLKQNYGPKCNFKKRRVRKGDFCGFPAFSRFVQERFATIETLHDFYTVEQCSLDYDTDRGAAIDFHIDDCWIWGNRIPTLSLLSDSILTLRPYMGSQDRYNLNYLSSLFSSKSWEFNNKDCSNEAQASIKYIRIPMPQRSLLVLHGHARYAFEHAIFREDIKDRRVCLTYRELSEEFIQEKKDIKDILFEATKFWPHTSAIET